MSDVVSEVLSMALDSFFTPRKPGEREYQGKGELLHCRKYYTPVQCRVKFRDGDRTVPYLCRCQQEAAMEKERQDELLKRQRKTRKLEATRIRGRCLLKWDFAAVENNKDI